MFLILFQFKEFLSSYNKMSEHCFEACTHDFSERQVQKAEVLHFYYCESKKINEINYMNGDLIHVL